MPKILKTSKKSDKKQNKITIYFFSAAKGLIFFINGLIPLSLFILKNSSNTAFVYAFSFVLMALGGFISGFSAYKKLRGRGFFNGIIAASIYMGVLFVLIIALMKFQVKTNILLIAPICLLSGFFGGTVGANT